jgi:hypothetical protein
LLFHHVEYTNSCKRWLINQGVAAQKSNIPAGKYLRVGKKNKKIKKEKKPVRSKASLLRDYSITTSWFIFFFDPFIIEEEQQEKKRKTKLSCYYRE